MKRVFPDAVDESDVTAKFFKTEPKIEVKEEQLEDEDLAHLGSESIPSPTSSTSPPASIEAIIPVKMPKFMELKCGALLGRLHTELFICPGIRERCIEVRDCPGVLLTPVEFTIKAEKSKQKDWKGAIKHNGRMLRTLMEFKQLDFYNHHETCSFKCHSRNYITKNGGSAQKPPATPRVIQHQQRRHSAAPTSQFAMNQFLQGELMKNPNFLAAFAAHCSAQNNKRQEEAERKLQQKQQAVKSLLENDPVTFWNQTIQSKLSAVVMNAFIRELGTLAQNLHHGRDVIASASKISQVLKVLGISDTLSREMCGEFILPSSTSTSSTELRIDSTPISINDSSSTGKVLAILPTQIPSTFPSFNNNKSISNINNNLILSSSEKLELMIKNAT